MSRSSTPTQADFDATRAEEEARIIHKAGSRIEKHVAVLAATSRARFQQHPDDMEHIIAIRGGRASGRVSPTDMFLKNKALNSERKGCQDRQRCIRAAAKSLASKYNDDNDDELEAPGTVRRKIPVTARRVAPPAPSTDDDDEQQEIASSRRKPKATSIKDITGLFRKLKLSVGDERKAERKKHGKRA
ncbi:hypothetical protein GL218_08164 [Daldinia childiae]|uniref:uncharacterized protein n=1 Tax=Daldinia childiae TaxID=326645 RepID=UPI00144893EF|nr:uncharacterized protein GL218_08164 [Daldinia childiae]KAF3069038.1 hypothetical protein GL218_08164 [Daldinia childiae]